jgi:hypothetical protein
VAQRALQEIAKRSKFSVDVIDPPALGLPDRHIREDSAELVELKQRIAKAMDSSSRRLNTITVILRL